jgi:hypothetical protein
MRRSFAAVVFATVLVGGLSGVQTATGRSGAGDHMISLHGVDGFRLGIGPDTTYEQALRRFGPLRPPIVYVRFRGGVLCTLISTNLGLSLVFDSLLDVATPTNCTWFDGATVTGPAWGTPEGLRIGAPLRALRTLYPSAYDAGLAKPIGVPTWSAWWWLTPTYGHGRQPVLMAYVKHQRVIALELAIVGH